MNAVKKMPFVLLLCFALCLAGSAGAESATLRGYTGAGYTYVTFGQYPQEHGDSLSPILWRVLKADDASAYLLSEAILDSRPVHEDKKAYRSWETSDLYEFLNGDFLYTAFSAEEARALMETESGRVTLLSADEVRDASMGFDDNASHRALGTAYAKERGLDSYSGKVRYSPWWL
ncbi:MAG: hypothetical protein IJ174_05165, partial [Clostridia bacterium]|nr:hypothetical protein [Clostridia bacterium]